MFTALRWEFNPIYWLAAIYTFLISNAKVDVDEVTESSFTLFDER